MATPKVAQYMRHWHGYFTEVSGKNQTGGGPLNVQSHGLMCTRPPRANFPSSPFTLATRSNSLGGSMGEMMSMEKGHHQVGVGSG